MSSGNGHRGIHRGVVQERVCLAHSPKPVAWGVQSPNPLTRFGMFRPQAGPNLKLRIKLFLSMDCFVLTDQQDIPHYPLIVTKLLSPEGHRFGGLIMPRRMNPLPQPAETAGFSLRLLTNNVPKPPTLVGYIHNQCRARTEVFSSGRGLLPHFPSGTIMRARRILFCPLLPGSGLYVPGLPDCCTCPLLLSDGPGPGSP